MGETALIPTTSGVVLLQDVHVINQFLNEYGTYNNELHNTYGLLFKHFPKIKTAKIYYA